MEKFFSGPIGILLVLAQAGIFFWVMRSLFLTAREDDDSIGAAHRPRQAKRGPRARPHRPDASDHGSRGWSRGSSVLETFMDPASGAMSGFVRSGPFAGRRLEDLSRPECLRLYELCRTEDFEAALFLQAYLNRRFAGGDWGGFGAKGQRRAEPPSAAADAMTRERAYATLGLAYGASDEDIHKAYRALIKKHHPDHGGSTAKAAAINEAKDLLLERGA